MRLTLGEAADQLGVSTKTLKACIKSGSIHAEFESGKYYLSSTEVDRVAGEMSTVGTETMDRPDHMSRPVTSVVTIPRAEWDSLMARLGYLESQKRLLLEDKASQERLSRELAVARDTIRAQAARLEAAEADAREKLIAFEDQWQIIKEARASSEAKARELEQVRCWNGRLEFCFWFLLGFLSLGTLAAGIAVWLR